MISLGRDPGGERASDDSARSAQLGELLRAYRVRRGMTQRQLAELSTVSIRAIRDIEQGKAVRPRSATMRLIADGLGLTGHARNAFEAAATRTMRAQSPRPRAAELAPPPTPLGALVGRDREVDAVQNLLATGGERLVTIVGLGAVGKTRLAMEVAHRLDRMSFLVLWTSFEDSLTADARGAAGAASRWSSWRGSPVAELLFRSAAQPELRLVLERQPCLLVLDDYSPRHVPTDRIVSLFRQWDGLRILITSREQFDIDGGLRLPLFPLRVPSMAESRDCAQLSSVPSVHLFLERMRQIQPAFRLTDQNAGKVATLCRQVDGIPAALAAVAPWALIHGLDALAQEALIDPVGLVGRLATGCGNTDPLAALQQAIDASSPGERRLLAAVATCETAWSTADAETLIGEPRTVCGLLVQRLLMRGLVRPVHRPGTPHFAVLELVRRLCREAKAHPLGVAPAHTH